MKDLAREGFGWISSDPGSWYVRGIEQRLGEDDEFDKNRELGVREQNGGKVSNWICPGSISSKFHGPILATSC